MNLSTDLVGDEPEKVEGSPGAVQLMGKPMQDEELIEMMKVVEKLLKQN